MAALNSEKTRRLTLAAIFVAIILAMSVIPYTGYISYGVIDITTLHIPVILAAVFLGWKYGAAIGAIWGLSCLVRAAVLIGIPGYAAFVNPCVSVLPRIVVGIVAGAMFALCKKKLPGTVSAGIAAVCATLTNTVLVLTFLYVFGAFSSLSEMISKTISTIFAVVISVNGIIELSAAVIICPIIYIAVSKFRAHRTI